MTLITSDRPISRCPSCGAWRWWNRCFTCVPKVAQVHYDDDKGDAA